MNLSKQPLPDDITIDIKLSVARVACELAKNYIIMMQGDPRDNPHGDKILAAVLDQLDEALKE